MTSTTNTLVLCIIIVICSGSEVLYDLLKETTNDPELFRDLVASKGVANDTVPAGLARSLLSEFYIKNLITEGFPYSVEEEKAVFKLYFSQKATKDFLIS